MAPPFEQAPDPMVYVILGALTAFALVSAAYIIHMHRKLPEETETDQESQEEKLRTDNIGLSKKAEDLLNQVLENPEMQNELPDRLDVSKATVSNAVTELKDRGLIIRKKKGASYLIEPDREELEKQQR